MDKELLGGEQPSVEDRLQIARTKIANGEIRGAKLHGSRYYSRHVLARDTRERGETGVERKNCVS